MSDQNGLTCRRCGYRTNDRSNFIRHFKRKNPCRASLEDICTQTLLNNFLEKPNDDIYKCKYCSRTFNAYQNRHKHHQVCKGRFELSSVDNAQSDMITKMQEQIQQLSDKIQSGCNAPNQTTNNTTMNTNHTINNIVQLNIRLRDFGRENLDAIPHELLRNCFMNLEVRDLIESLHFDEEFPENNNIRLVSLKHEIMELFKNNEWQAMSLLNGLNELIGQACSIFRKFYHTNKHDVHEDVGGEEEALLLLEKLDEMDNMNEKLLKPIRTDIRALLYGKRDRSKTLESSS